MTNNGQQSIDREVEGDLWDLSNSPFFTDFDPSIPVNPIGFSIPRPHRPPMDPAYTRELIAHLKKLMVLNEPVQAI